MTGKGDFTEGDWRIVLEGPRTAGMIVVTAQRGGTFRETLAIAKAYVEARKHHGESELLDEIVSAKPEIDRTRYRSAEELKEHGLQHLRDAVELLERKASPEELDDYKPSCLTSPARSPTPTAKTERASAPTSVRRSRPSPQTLDTTTS
jgi:hypothetical protein